MASTLGGLIVSLGLDAAQFITGMSKAELQAKKLGDKIEKGINEGAKNAAKGIALIEAGLIAAAVAVDVLIHKAASFQDIEERTGASAEALASFSVSAAAAGVTVDDIGGAMNKLAKNLTGVDDESKAAGAALTALGIPIDDFKKQDPATQMETIAKALGGFADGAQKGAVAMALFGKSGAQLLPFFKELENGAGRVVILTDKQIKQADEFADAQKRQAEKISLYAQALAVEAIPVIQATIDAGKDFAKTLFNITDESGKLDPAKIRDYAESAARAIAALIDTGDVLVRVLVGIGLTAGAAFAQVAEAAKGNFRIALQIGREWQADMKRLVDRPLFSTNLEQNLAKQKEIAKQRLAEDRGFVPKNQGKKVLDFEGAQKKDKGTEALAQQKALLDQGLKAQENVIRDTQDALKDHTHFLDSYYDRNLVSIKDYYSERGALEEEAQQKIATALQRQVELQRAFANRPELKESDRIEAATKLADLEYRRDRQVQDGLTKAFDLTNAAAKATQQYKDSVAEVDAQMKELAGDTAAATAIRFDLSHRDLVNRATVEGDQTTVDQVAALRAQAVARDKLSDATRDYGRIQAQLGIEQGRIELAQHSGEITSLEAINRRAAAATAYADKLRQQLAVQEQIAQTLKGQDYLNALQGIEALKLQIDQLNESANELDNTFRSTFEDAFSSNLADAITQTKSWADAFRDAEKQIVRSITNIASQNIAESVFGKSGPASGVSGFLASLFGGKSGGGNFLDNIGQGGGGGGGIGSIFSSLFGGFFADGGTVGARKAIVVGERGPEIFQPFAAGNIIPNSELEARRAGRNVNVGGIHITVQGNVSRSTVNQIAVQTAAQLRRATAKDA